MKTTSMVKLVMLLIVGIGTLLMYSEILPPGVVNGVLFCLALVASVFLFLSTSFSGEQKKIRKKLIVTSIMILLWYTIVPYVFSKKAEIPFNESLWAAVIFGAFMVIVVVLIIKDSSDIDRLGNKKWITISKRDFGCTIVATIAFVTTLIFCIYTYYSDFPQDISVLYSMLGIITMRKL